jgi:hypothetical protein
LINAVSASNNLLRTNNAVTLKKICQNGKYSRKSTESDCSSRGNFNEKQTASGLDLSES